MVGILGRRGVRSVDSCRDGSSASLVEEINLVGTSHPNLILESDFIGATVAEIGDELEKIDISIGNRGRCWRRKEEGSNGEGFEDRGGHRDDSAEVVDHNIK